LFGKKRVFLNILRAIERVKVPMKIRQEKKKTLPT